MRLAGAPADLAPGATRHERAPAVSAAGIATRLALAFPPGGAGRLQLLPVRHSLPHAQYPTARPAAACSSGLSLLSLLCGTTWRTMLAWPVWLAGTSYLSSASTACALGALAVAARAVVTLCSGALSGAGGEGWRGLARGAGISGGAATAARSLPPLLRCPAHALRCPAAPPEGYPCMSITPVFYSAFGLLLPTLMAAPQLARRPTVLAGSYVHWEALRRPPACRQA